MVAALDDRRENQIQLENRRAELGRSHWSTEIVFLPIHRTENYIKF